MNEAHTQYWGGHRTAGSSQVPLSNATAAALRSIVLLGIGLRCACRSQSSSSCDEPEEPVPLLTPAKQGSGGMQHGVVGCERCRQHEDTHVIRSAREGGQRSTCCARVRVPSSPQRKQAQKAERAKDNGRSDTNVVSPVPRLHRTFHPVPFPRRGHWPD
jgi:hypothetical protein